MSDQRTDELVEQLCAGQLDAAEASEAANELLNSIFNGASVELVRRLVRCGEAQAVNAGAWIISELATDAAPLRDEIALLLKNPARNARFFAMDAVLVAEFDNDGPLIANVAELIDDPDGAVRWKALRTLSRIDLERLSHAVPYLADPRLKEHAQWLAGSGGKLISQSDILTRLSDKDKTTRMFAAAAAARLAPLDTQPLQHASESNDPDISSFAQDEYTMLRKPRKPN